jgi:hypothetical protein
MASQEADRLRDKRERTSSPGVEKDEKQGDACELGGCCGMIAGRGGKLRLGLLIVLAVVIVVLLVHGFATA